MIVSMHLVIEGEKQRSLKSRSIAFRFLGSYCNLGYFGAVLDRVFSVGRQLVAVNEPRRPFLLIHSVSREYKVRAKKPNCKSFFFSFLQKSDTSFCFCNSGFLTSGPTRPSLYTTIHSFEQSVHAFE